MRGDDLAHVAPIQFPDPAITVGYDSGRFSPSHTTLGGSRSYQSMTGHYEAATGAIGINALGVAGMYGDMNSMVRK